MWYRRPSVIFSNAKIRMQCLIGRSESKTNGLRRNGSLLNRKYTNRSRMNAGLTSGKNQALPRFKSTKKTIHLKLTMIKIRSKSNDLTIMPLQWWKSIRKLGRRKSLNARHATCPPRSSPSPAASATPPSLSPKRSPWKWRARSKIWTSATTTPCTKLVRPNLSIKNLRNSLRDQASRTIKSPRSKRLKICKGLFPRTNQKYAIFKIRCHKVTLAQSRQFKWMWPNFREKPQSQCHRRVLHFRAMRT